MVINKKQKRYTLIDMEKAFVAGGKLARNIQNPGFDEFIKKIENDNRN